eukprot:g1990.t1
MMIMIMFVRTNSTNDMVSTCAYLEPDVRQTVASHCDISKLTSDEMNEMNRWADEMNKSFKLSSCVSEMEQVFREEWLHVFREDACDFSQYVMPTFNEESFLTPNFHEIRTEYPVVAYFIVSYRQPVFLERMIRRLQSEDGRNMILIHIDVRTSPSFELAVKRIASKIPNVRVVRFGTIVYGGSTVVQYVTSAMRWFEENHLNWNVFVALTGQDYPLLSASQFSDMLLTEHGNRTWIGERDGNMECGMLDERGHSASPTLQPQVGRSTHFHYPCLGDKELYRIKNRYQWLWDDEKFPLFCKGTTMSTGIFHRNEVRFFLNDEYARKAYAFFRFTMIPEEHFWISILTNLVSKDRVVNRAPCFMSWNKGHKDEGDMFHNTFLTMGQVTEIKNAFCTGKVFARKFDLAIDSDVLDWIDDGSELKC